MHFTFSGSTPHNCCFSLERTFASFLKIAANRVVSLSIGLGVVCERIFVTNVSSSGQVNQTWRWLAQVAAGR